MTLLRGRSYEQRLTDPGTDQGERQPSRPSRAGSDPAGTSRYCRRCRHWRYCVSYLGVREMRPVVLLVLTIGKRNDDERPRAYVVLNPGKTATAQDIATFMDGKVSWIKRITGGVVFLDAIPKNPSGKILRKALRDQAQKEVQQSTGDVRAKL